MSYEFAAGDPHAALAAAKDQFRQAMLENDAFAAIVLDRMSVEQPSGLPDFGCEPTCRPNDDGTTRFGVRFSHSMTEADAPLTVSFSTYDYLELADVDMSSGDARLTDELKEALSRAGVEPESGAPIDILNTWQTGWNGIVRSLKGQVGLDPMGYTVTLKSDLESRAYPMQDDEPREEVDPETLMAPYDWRINMPTDPDDPNFARTLKLIDDLRKRYGRENVLVNAYTRDPDTERLVNVPGKLGVFVLKSAIDEADS